MTAGDLTIVDFNPWWFNGSDALAIAFFRELGAEVGKSLTEKAKIAFRSLGRRLGSASPLIGAAVNLATAGAGGAAASSASSFVSDLLGSDRTVAQEYAEVAKSLRLSTQRYLVVIDDLDRLNPEDALLIFKLVKSAGRLPNVMYLLVFDRELTERTVAARFPTEGPHFLEKIVQAMFELPPPEADDLRDLLLVNVRRLMGESPSDRAVRYMNVFYDVVAPYIVQPRDVVRLVNALEVTWSAVAGDVDRADFLAIEALRLMSPRVHRAIYRNKSLVCAQRLEAGRGGVTPADCDARLLGDEAERDRPALRQALMRLFPALEGPWSNRFYDPAHSQTWRRERRICVEANFGTYFRLAISDQAAPAAEINLILERADDNAFVQMTLREALATPRRRGGTRASLLLDELTFHAPAIAEDKVAPLVISIFNMADELDVAADEDGGFSIGDNFLRIYWLLNRLVRERLEQNARDALLEAAALEATLGWLLRFATGCVDDHRPRQDGRLPDDRPLVSAAAAERIRLLALDRIEAAVASGDLPGLPDFVSILFRWRDLIGDGGIERVRNWLGEHMDEDRVVIALAQSFISFGWSHSIGDRVAKRTTNLQRRSVELLVDVEAFRTRIAGLLTLETLAHDDRLSLERFETQWANRDRGPRED